MVLQLPRNFVDFFFFQKAVLSWPLVMGAFPKLVMGVERRRLPPLDDSYSQGVGSQAREVAQLTNTLHKL